MTFEVLRREEENFLHRLLTDLCRGQKGDENLPLISELFKARLSKALQINRENDFQHKIVLADWMESEKQIFLPTSRRC